MCAVAHIRTREFLPLMYLAYHHTYTSFVMRRKYFSFEVTHKENPVLMLVLVTGLLLFFSKKTVQMQMLINARTFTSMNTWTQLYLYEYL